MKETIVITDHNSMINSILEYRLKRDGYNVLFFEDGERAMSYIRKNPFDLLVTNFYMPLINGVEVIQYIRNHVSKKVPILVVSSSQDEEIRSNVFKIGADDFIEKPFRAGELSVRIKRLLK